MPPYISNDLKGCIPALYYEKGYSVKKSVSFSTLKKPWPTRPSNSTGNLVFLTILMLANGVYALTALQAQISHSSVHFSISNIQYIWTKFMSSYSHFVVSRCQYLLWRCKMVNWLFTLGFPVQTNTDGSFLVVLRLCMWSDGINIGNYNSLARMLSNNVKNITRIM